MAFVVGVGLYRDCRRGRGYGLCRGKVRAVVVGAKAMELSDKGTLARSLLRCHKSLLNVGLGVPAQAAALFRKNDTGRTFVPVREKRVERARGIWMLFG